MKNHGHHRGDQTNCKVLHNSTVITEVVTAFGLELFTLNSHLLVDKVWIVFLVWFREVLFGCQSLEHSAGAVGSVLPRHELGTARLAADDVSQLYIIISCGNVP